MANTMPAAELQQAAAQAARESHPYTDPRANYDIARTTREARTEGAGRRAT